ncbi:ABC transporter substrate-binding protein [Trebonia kvetii]|uniref:ABC transporter substrate-binding protein n=1 Tax=Trebonia kvetii TaxID=2480626 RepID=A0A6P2C281_9ACTN|nr:ABC transporter substrate-binding protein [Trebonia kvetii]TVZ03593.1 ABC transporter substrate-binding protein [Trebonia kvetii]
MLTTHSRSARIAVAATVGTALALTAAACSSSSSGGTTPASTASASSTSSAAGIPAADNLKAAGCPATIVLQTDWNPEAEHGGQYELVGANPTINSGAKSVTGELVAHGGIDTGVKIQIRAGGPAIGYQTVTSQMYKDSSITLGYLGTDEQISLSATQPTVAVMAGLEISPQIIQWSPAAHPAWKTIADIGKTSTPVLYFQGASYMDYLTGNGILKKSQVNGSYDGTPTVFVASGGQDAVQGFATAEPYIWSHDVRSWDKPLKYELIADAGFNFYQQQIGVRKGDLASLTPCLKKLVPIMQQAIVDYMANPAPVEKLILQLVTAYNNGWTYTQGTADYAVATMKKLGIVGNAPDGTLGAFQDARVQQLIGILTPIYAKAGKQTLKGLKPSDIVTNEFIDPSISLK